MNAKTNLGAVTAYAIAVKYGYTGTEEEWAQQFENIGEYTEESIREIVAKGNETLAAIQKKAEDSLSLLPGDIAQVGADISRLSESLTDFRDGISEHHKSVNLFDKSKITENKILSGQNKEQAINGCFYTDYIPVEADKTYCFQDNIGYLGQNGKTVCCYDENFNFTSVVNLNDIIVNNGAVIFPISTTKYVRVNGRTSNIDTFMLVEGNELPPYEPYFEGHYYIKREALPKDISDFKDEITVEKSSKNLFNKNSHFIKTDKFVQGSGDYTSLSGSNVTHPIPIKKGTSYTFHIATGYYGSNALVVRGCDSEGTLIASYIATNNNDGTATITFDNSVFAEYVVVNVRATVMDTFMFVEGTTMPEYEPYVEPHLEIKKEVLPSDIPLPQYAEANPLWGKKLAVNGDSICYGAGSSGGYSRIIADNNSMSLSNIAMTGGTIASGTTQGGGNRHWICRTIENMPTDADYYILEGGSNDVALGVPIGTLTNGYMASLDDSTFYGAMESVCKQMITKFKGKKYGFIIVHQMKGGMQIANKKYTAIIECCNKWGIPYLDLAKNCVPFGLFEKDWGNELSALRNTYTADDGTGHGDGWHPNAEGYKKYYVPKIEAWMKTL